MLIERGDTGFDVPEKERITTRVATARKKVKSALKAQTLKARNNIQGGVKRQVKRVRTNVQSGLKARKAEVINTAYNVYVRKQNWDPSS